MKTYPKIQSIFKRDPKTNYSTFLEGEYSRPEFEYLQNNIWEWTEKINGTNIRVLIGGDKPKDKSRTGHISVDFKGRTDNAQIPIFLLDKLKEIFYDKNRMNDMYKIFDFTEEGGTVCLYGEGYGARINKGGVYIPEGVDFILFDIKIGNFWLKREDIEKIAQDLQLQVVPIVCVGTLHYAIDLIKSKKLLSRFISDNILMEGIVGKPNIELKDRMGRRIIIKIKHKDYRIK